MISRAIIVAWSTLAAASAAGDARASASYGMKVRLGGAAGSRELPIMDIGICIEVPNGEITPGSRLVAGICDDPTRGLDTVELPESRDHLVTFHSRTNSTMCMHAEPLAEGTFVRLRTCRDSNMYQAFSWWANSIKPIGDRTLCVAHHGDTPEVDDFIVLRNCSESTNDWSFD